MSKEHRNQGIGRREILAGGGLLAAGGLWGANRLSLAEVGRNREGMGVYESLGLKTLINCKGTFTIISGSLTLPEVKRAMDEASRHYVHLDELMEAVGRRLAELTGAESGIVTAGCSAAETLAT